MVICLERLFLYTKNGGKDCPLKLLSIYLSLRWFLVSVTVKLWNTSTGKCLLTISEHEDWIYSLSFSPDNNLLASGSADQTLRLWDTTTGKQLKTPMEHPDTVWSVTFSPCGKKIISGSQDQTIRIWDLKTGKCLQVLQATRLYEGTNITDAYGLTAAQKLTLKTLGAVDRKKLHNN